MATKTMNYTSKGIIGLLLEALTNVIGARWVDRTSIYVDSDEETEHHAWMGGIPGMRERGEGSRLAKQVRDFNWSIRNKKFDATINVPLDLLRRDKTGQLQSRINDLSIAGERHWSSLLSTLVEDGESSLCYDGQFFFDTDHSEGDSGTLSNDITTDISAIPANVHGVVAAPSPEEMKSAIFKSIKQLYTLKDDQGEFINQDVTDFTVMVPMGLLEAAAEALSGQFVGAGSANLLTNLQIDGNALNFDLVQNPRLSWTDKFATFVGGGQALIRQEEVQPMAKSLAEGSDHEFNNDEWLFAIDTIRNAGYGRWQHAVLNTLT